MKLLDHHLAKRSSMRQRLSTAQVLAAASHTAALVACPKVELAFEKVAGSDQPGGQSP